MSGLRFSYIGRGSRRQPIGDAAQRQSPPFLRAMAVAAAMLAAAGCARVGLPSFDAGDVTGSIPASTPAAAPVANGVDPSDWKSVQQALAGMAADEKQDGIGWRNPTTGSAGMITAYAAETTSAGYCRVFATTVNDTRGVRRYRGEACRTGADWKLTRVMAEDGKLN